MNVFAHFADRIRAILGALDLGIAPADLARIVVEPTRDAAHGDLATNAAMVLAKPLRLPPRELGNRIAAALREQPDVRSAEVAGPGFVNITLDAAFWSALLRQVLRQGSEFGRSDMGRNVRVNVEYVSANPTGPMHVGHCRGAAIGDALANLLDFAGYDVTREYYINDAGGQVDTLARSAFLRYREALGEAIGAVPEGLYPGDYLLPLGAALANEFGPRLQAMAEGEWLPLVRERAVLAMMDMIRADLASLNIRHDVFFSELALHAHGAASEIARTIEFLRQKGLVHEGRLPPPQGQVAEDWEDREQTLFGATQFGDDIDRPLVKSDGSYTYFAADVAYFRSKFLRGYSEMIYVLGADHGGYVKRLEAIGKAISGEQARVVVRLCQLVRLLRAGEPVKMSKRAGSYVTLSDVVDEVGADAVRFMMLFRKSDAPLDFDFAVVTEQSKDNPVFYVQYAHARCASVLRAAREAMPDLDTADAALAEAPTELLRDAGEIGLVRRLAEWPRIVQAAAGVHEPHRVAFYLYDLASDLHAHWNRGKEDASLRFVNSEERDSTRARLALVRGISMVLSAGLGILGVTAPDIMR